MIKNKMTPEQAELVDSLREMARNMRKVSSKLLSFSNEYAVPEAEEKARELIGAAQIADDWAETFESAL
jgi:hypothetical protein